MKKNYDSKIVLVWLLSRACIDFFQQICFFLSGDASILAITIILCYGKHDQ